MFPYEYISLNTSLQAIAVKAALTVVITLCCIYIPPNDNLNITELQRLIDQLPKPFLLLGDFNTHNEIWGSRNHNRRGKEIETFMTINNLICLNTGESTYMSYQTASAIDSINN